jgi:dihydrofolate reductase
MAVGRQSDQGATHVARTFLLLAVVSADGFIARRSGDPPWAWASAEEQARFRATMDQVSWSVLGRVTHETAFRPDRRRIVFTRGVRGIAWLGANHLGFNPAGASFDEAAATAGVEGTVAILGGTRVHDHMLAIGRIDEVRLSIEPVRFGQGLPLFSGVPWPAVDDHLADHGLRRSGPEETLNAAGTVERRYCRPLLNESADGGR